MIMKNKKSRNKIKLLAALCLFALLSLGATLAYMTDYEAAENRFTVGSVDFNLYEHAWDGELPDGGYATASNATASNALGKNQAANMYAGKEIPKDPAIKNNSKNDAYLRMTVKIPVAYVILSPDPVEEDGYHIYEYIYTGGGSQEIPVPAGHDIPPLFYTVSFANVVGGQLEDEIQFIYVDFKAIQSGGFADAQEAWEAYDHQSR